MGNHATQDEETNRTAPRRGVFASRRARKSKRERTATPAGDDAVTEAGKVTLVVYEWDNVQPGTLSWVFPSVQAARAAVTAMRNAVRWSILFDRKTVESGSSAESGVHTVANALAVPGAAI